MAARRQGPVEPTGPSASTQPVTGPAFRVAGAALGLGLLAAAAWALPVTRQHPAPADLQLGWILMTVLAGLAELSVVHVHTRREAHAISLSELALVCGLFFAAPGGFIVGRAIGAGCVYLAWRRQRAIKVGFNLALNLTESCLALAVFHLVGGAAGIGPRGWLAAVTAAAAAAVLTAVAVSCVISLVEGTPLGSGLPRELVRGVAAAGTIGVLGLVAAHALTQSPLAAIPLVACLAVLLAGYRRYAWLWERHLGLERLHRSNQALQSSPGADDALLAALRQTQEVARAEHSEIVFLRADAQRASVRVDIGDAGRLRRTRMPAAEAEDPLWAELAGGAPYVLARGSSPATIGPYLSGRGLRDAVLVPIRGEAGVVGVLLTGNHASQVRAFDDRDVPLLQAVANQAGMALQRGELVDRLRHDALHDALTGLPNRANLHAELNAAVARVDDGEAAGLAVVVLDLIGFRQVNDVLGGRLADALLHEVGHRLQTALGSAGMLGRLGSDEFAALVPGTTTVEAAMAVAIRLGSALERAVQVDGIDIEVGASIGVSVAPQHGLDADLLLKRAESALDQAKRGGSGLQPFEPHLERSLSAAKLALLGELRQAILNGDMQIFVQPQADLDSGRVVGAEALVRWHHPLHGFLPPDEFIPLAERSGLIRPLTSFVLARAVAACGQWRAAGLDLSIGVNLSARSVLDPGLVDSVGSLLSLHGVPPSRLTLEITESSVIGDPARTQAVLDQLHQIGVRLSIDDFGTGYASLSYLRELPVQEVKIDKSFVMGMGVDPDDEAIVRSVIDLGSHLGLEVVAEGVEDSATWARLAALGCTLVQGYFLARPMPEADFIPWLRANASPRLTTAPTQAAESPVHPQPLA